MYSRSANGAACQITVRRLQASIGLCSPCLTMLPSCNVKELLRCPPCLSCPVLTDQFLLDRPLGFEKNALLYLILPKMA